MVEPAVAWDAERGHLRLTLAHLAELARLSLPTADADDRGGARLRVELEAAGCVAGTAIDPQLGPLAAAVARPLATVQLDVQTRDGHQACPGWVSPHVAVLAVPTGEAEGSPHDLVSGPPSHLPRRIAGLVGLGPRPRALVDGVIELDGRAFALLLRDGAGVTVEGADASWRTALELLGAEFDVQWRVAARWRSPEGPTGRMATVVDAGSWWVVEPAADGRVRLRPADGTAVWGLLTGLLPRDAELAR